MTKKIIKKRKRDKKSPKVQTQKKGFNILHISEKKLQIFKTYVEDHVFEPGFGTASAH